jgi:hypothetical protein
MPIGPNLRVRPNTNEVIASPIAMNTVLRNFVCSVTASGKAGRGVEFRTGLAPSASSFCLRLVRMLIVRGNPDGLARCWLKFALAGRNHPIKFKLSNRVEMLQLSLPLFRYFSPIKSLQHGTASDIRLIL